jgi:zinc protease
MKKLFFSICALSVLSVSVQAQPLDRSIRPKPGPAPEIKLADAQSFTLANGLKVFVVENHKTPVVTYSIQLDIRPEVEGEKAGVADMVGSLLTSGTKKRTKDKFELEMDEIGAYIGAGSSSIYGRSLKKHQDKMLELMSDALLNPDFKKEELEKLVKQAESGLISAQNDPEQMLSNVSRVLVYGKDHPYGDITTDLSVKNIKIEDCKKYYDTYFKPNVGYMAVVGDITVEEAKSMVEKYFGAWKKADVPRATYPDVYATPTNEVAFVPRLGSVQSVIGISYPINLKIGTPDAMKVRVLNEILGGSSQGRLFLNLRETHGWTYGAYSSMSPDDIVGSFNIFLKCRNEVTDSAIEEALKEMEYVRTNNIDEETLQSTKNYIAGIFALGLENPQTIAQYAINIERYNMHKDYYKNYLKNLSLIKAVDIKGVARKYIAPQNSRIIVVGNKSEISKLKRFAPEGDIQFYDNYGGRISNVESKVIDGVSIDDVLAKYIKAIGGKEAIEKLVDLEVNSTLTMMGQEYRLSEQTISPNKYIQSVSFHGPSGPPQTSAALQAGPQSQMLQRIVLNGDEAVMLAGGDKQRMPQSQVVSLKNQANLQAVLNPEQYKISYALLGITEEEGTKAYNVEKGEDEGRKKSIQYYDVSTGLLFKEVITSQENGMPKVEVYNYSDYKEVKNGNGFKIPFKTTVAGNRPSSQSVINAKANSGIKEKEFKL